MEKVLLTKVEAEALESALLVEGSDKSQVVEWHLQNLWSGNREPLNKLSLDTIINAMYVGYELDNSPEEKIKEYYKEHCVKEGPGYHIGVLDGIQQTLNFLNIKIPGVNS